MSKFYFVPYLGTITNARPTGVEVYWEVEGKHFTKVVKEIYRAKYGNRGLVYSDRFSAWLFNNAVAVVPQ